MRKILVVDNSALMRRILCDIINADTDFHVVDMSMDGEDAYNKIMSNTYDLVVMEIVLPRMDGLTILQKLQQQNKSCKVIAVSTAIREEAEETLKALEYGAYDFVSRPVRLSGQYDDFQTHLLRVMHNALDDNSKGNVPLVRVNGTLESVPKVKVSPIKPQQSPKKEQVSGRPELIFIASSTGGPKALHTVFEGLTANVNVPIVIVQHMPKGFTAALAERLDKLSSLRIKEAEDGDILQPGWVYIAPGGHHMLIAENQNKQAYLSINKEPPVNSLRPCADVTMESLSSTSYRNILCVVLTGMGADATKGIQELQGMKDLYVITESQETCVVYGMPRSVVQHNLSNESAPIDKISEAIIKKLGV